MPPRLQPKVYLLVIKTHKLSLFLTVPSSSTVNDLKVDILGALQSDVLATPSRHDDNAMDDNDWEVPKVSDMNDFELAKAVKEKGRPTGRYEGLDGKAQLKNVAVNWELIFVQFKDGNGELLPVKVSIPPLLADEEEDSSATRKGKRKAVE